ncbi:acyltransferase [Citrobacter braakii]|uniref:acyltransferase n=1 Tax=Citrobacter braakii TaxID=57706 RepID=UPI000CDD387D|nr:acyltransferase family protein [Citrobacter braakii]POT61941.1 acyltransferase [Citrobacter braakii]
MKNNTEKSLNIDLLRIVSCFLVVVLHCVVIGMNDSSYEYWNELNIIESFTRISVPLFIMITGSLLMREKTDLTNALKRSKRLLFILVSWSDIYYSYLAYIGKSDFKLSSFLGMLIRNQIFYHLWYLYAAIGFVLMIPILSAFYHSASRKDVIIFTVSWMIFLFFGLINLQLNLNININWSLQIQIFSSLSVYLIIGKLIKDSAIKVDRVTITISVMLIVICTISTSHITKLITPYGGPVNQLFYDNSSLFVGISAISFMFLFMGINVKSNIIIKTINLISPCTLGIYLIHPIIIDALRLFIFEKYKIVTGLGVVTTMPIIIFAISLVSILILRKIGLSRFM